MQQKRKTKQDKTDKEKQLRNDVRFLGNILGQVIKEQEGEEIFDIEEKIRALTKEMRTSFWLPGLKFLHEIEYIPGDLVRLLLDREMACV